MCQQLRANRRQAERRSRQSATFPLWDSEGNLVYVDRRYQPDQRLENINARIVE